MSRDAVRDEASVLQRPGQAPAALLLSVVVPVYNQAGSILENLGVIRERVAEGLGEAFELIVVSDGSVDETGERLLQARDRLLRVIHYDRNLGKGYAVKAGSLAARGRYISYVDADLDLDPGSIPAFLDAARRGSLDFAIGSKRHPGSLVHYPASRRAASWLYQQLVRTLFRLNVRDTQVGLKLYRREVAEAVMPLLLVKRYAFDLELLAVSRSLGYGRIEELPVRLDYRFAGSGIGSVAVLRALVDTAAIFYRLRILRYYARKRRLLDAGGYARRRGFAPLVSVIGEPAAAARLDYASVELLPPAGHDPAARRAAAASASGTVLAFLADGAVPAGNWLSTAVEFLGDDAIAAVVAPAMAPAGGTIRARAAAAVSESRLGGGSRAIRFTPGNLRFVRDFPATSVVVKRADFLATADPALAPERLCEELDRRGKRVVYTPETVVVERRPASLRGHFREVARSGRARARAVRRRGPRALHVSTVASLLLPAVLGLAAYLATRDGAWQDLGIALLATYAAAIVASGAVAALRFRSIRVGALAAAILPPTQATYASAFLAGLVGA